MAIGVGAMAHFLGGGSEHSPFKFYGKKIVASSMADEKLSLTFEDGQRIQIWDDGQSCCESRYMKTDDDIQSLVGHVLTRIEAKDGPTEESEDGDEHEIVFVEIGTDAGFITIANHNEHNGYYGGFGLTITVAGEE